MGATKGEHDEGDREHKTTKMAKQNKTGRGRKKITKNPQPPSSQREYWPRLLEIKATKNQMKIKKSETERAEQRGPRAQPAGNRGTAKRGKKK